MAETKIDVLSRRAEAATLFLNSATANPEAPEYGPPPDGVVGKQVVVKQLYNKKIKKPTGSMWLSFQRNRHKKWDPKVFDAYLMKLQSKNKLKFKLTPKRNTKGEPMINADGYQEYDIESTTTGYNCYSVRFGTAESITNAPIFQQLNGNGDIVDTNVTFPVGGDIMYYMLPGDGPFQLEDETMLDYLDRITADLLGFDFVDQDIKLYGGNSRLIGSNIKFDYTDVEINATGIITCFEVPKFRTFTQKWLTSSSLSVSDVDRRLTSNFEIINNNTMVTTHVPNPCYESSAPPCSESAALQTGTAAQTPVFDGLFMTMKVDFEDNRPQRPTAIPEAIVSTQNVDITQMAVYGQGMWTDNTLSKNGSLKLNKVYAVQNLQGHYLTELTETATLNVKYLYIYQVFPDNSDQEKLMFAKQAPDADDQTVESVQRVVKEAPIFYKAADNDTSKYSRGIMAFSRRLAAMAIPIAPLAFGGKTGLAIAAGATGILASGAIKKSRNAKARNQAKQKVRVDQILNKMEKMTLNNPSRPRTKPARKVRSPTSAKAANKAAKR